MKIENHKLDFSATAKPKIPAKENLGHKPGGGDKKVDHYSAGISFFGTARRIESVRNQCQARKSLQIESQKLVWKAESKIGSLENAQHKPAGGTTKVV